MDALGGLEMLFHVIPVFNSLDAIRLWVLIAFENCWSNLTLQIFFVNFNNSKYCSTLATIC
jgi:hypothetical protein